MVWTVGEIAEATGLTQGHISRLVKTGVIKGELKAMGWLIDDEEAMRFIQERKEHKDLRFKRKDSE